MNDTQTPDEELRADLDRAVEHLKAAVAVLRTLSNQPRAVRGVAWETGWDAVDMGEEAGRQAIDQAERGAALIRLALKVEPIQTTEVF